MILRLFSGMSISIAFGCIGCGSSSPQLACPVTYPVIVTPSTVTLDHMASGSENQVQFVGVGIASSPAGCPQRTDLKRLEYASWSNPDEKNIQINSSRDQTNGVATCLGATTGPVTLTGAFTPITIGAPSTDVSTATVTLTCK
jgi:hypothetical protein